MINWERVAKREQEIRRRVEDQRDRILNDLEDLVQRYDKPVDQARWSTISRTWEYPKQPCIRCGDPFVQRDSNVCRACQDELTGE